MVSRPWAWWLALQTVGWLAVLPMLKRAVPLSTLARLMWSAHHRERRAARLPRGEAAEFPGSARERDRGLPHVVVRREPILIRCTDRPRRRRRPRARELGISALRPLAAPGVFGGQAVVLIVADFGVRPRAL